MLVRDAERTGRVSFVEFYRRRIRRIVPAATLTLSAIAIAAWGLFGPTRAAQTWWDSVSAFLFVSNWRFAVIGTDYFRSDGPISPVRHFWSLSVEEQFYFVWPAVMAVVVLIASRKGLKTAAGHRLAGAVMTVLVLISFSWAVIDTTANPTWSYFSTLTRAWELGFGAVIAIFAAKWAAIPDSVRPVIAWFGLGMVAFGALWITEDIGFPGPWAAIPVLGTGIAIIAGTGGEVRYLAPITNPVSTTIGDLSYSLYLWHWPVIIFLGTYVDVSWQYYVGAVAITVALSTLAYYFVEKPILTSSWLKPREEQLWRPRRRHRDTLVAWLLRDVRARFTFQLTPSRQIGGLVGCTMLAVGVAALSTVPRDVPAYYSEAAVAGASSENAPAFPPALSALQNQLKDAVMAEKWPVLDPSMEAVIDGPKVAPDLGACGRGETCWFGEDSAPQTIVLVGDSIAVSYLSNLRAFVDSSSGRWKLFNQAVIGCPFISVAVRNRGEEAATECEESNQSAIDSINHLRPDVVLIANTYTTPELAGTDREISPAEWRTYTRQMIDRFSGAGSRVALLTAPPPDKSPAECYRPSGPPAACVGTLTAEFLERVEADSALADSVGGELIDTRLLFCTHTGYCPMFAGTTPMNHDRLHISPAFAEHAAPAFTEMLGRSMTFSSFP
nr:acyltransferase family protein [Mycolicibacterium phlei]